MTAPTFAQQIQPVIDALVAALVPIIGVGGYLLIAKMRVLISQLQISHETAKANTATLNQVAEQTNGINQAIQAHTSDLIDSKNAEIHAKDAVIEQLKKSNGGT